MQLSLTLPLLSKNRHWEMLKIDLLISILTLSRMIIFLWFSIMGLIGFVYFAASMRSNWACHPKESMVSYELTSKSFSTMPEAESASYAKAAMPVQNVENVKNGSTTLAENEKTSYSTTRKSKHFVNLIRQNLSTKLNLRIGFVWRVATIESIKKNNPLSVRVVEGFFIPNVFKIWVFTMDDLILSVQCAMTRKSSLKNVWITEYTFRKKMPIGNVQRKKISTSTKPWVNNSF